MRNPEIEDELRAMNTHTLLWLLEKSRAFGGDGYNLYGNRTANRFAYTEDIKEILATREHVPNKAERKLIRLQKVGLQKKRGKSWVKFNEKKIDRNKRLC